MTSLPDLEMKLRARALAYGAIRTVLTDAGAIEVATPIASNFPDLAPVPQLVARHPLSGSKLCLRIAPEEHLTRLIARGIPGVFEISTNFRAETVDRTHLIEFQSVEAIFAGREIDWGRRVVEDMCRAVDRAVREIFDWRAPSFSPAPFAVVHLPEWIEAYTGISADELFTLDGLNAVASKIDAEVPDADRRDSLADAIIQRMADHFEEPVFITSLPDYLGGPAEPNPAWPRFHNRSELYLKGVELGSLANQLSNFEALRARYVLNHDIRSARKIEPNIINQPCLDDYLRGLPAYCGLGIGVDRLLMHVTGIDDVRHLHPFVYE